MPHDPLQHVHPKDPYRRRSGFPNPDLPWKTTRNHDVGAAIEIEEGVVVPGFTDTLEWVLDSPPNVHQFEEPPVSFSEMIFFNNRKLP